MFSVHRENCVYGFDSDLQNIMYAKLHHPKLSPKNTNISQTTSAFFFRTTNLIENFAEQTNYIFYTPWLQ